MNSSTQKDILLLAARILLASLFLVMGWNKLSGFTVAEGYMQSLHVPFPAIAASVAIIIELGAGIALLFGFLTTPIAYLLALYTIVTALIGHQFWTMSGMMQYDMMIHFYKNLSIAGGLTVLGIQGPGRYSLIKGHSS